MLEKVEPFIDWLTSTNSFIVQILLKVNFLDLPPAPKEPNGETVCWRYYSNDFRGVL